MSSYFDPSPRTAKHLYFLMQYYRLDKPIDVKERNLYAVEYWNGPTLFHLEEVRLRFDEDAVDTIIWHTNRKLYDSLK